MILSPGVNKILGEEESRRRVDELINTGYDVLIREYERDGEWVISKRWTGENTRRGALFTQCFDQDHPRPAVFTPYKRAS